MVEIHERAISELYKQKVAGEISAEECTLRSLPHAEAIAALTNLREQEAILEMVRFMLARPKVVESMVVGALHYLKNQGDTDAR